MGKRTESGNKTMRSEDDLARRVVAIEIFWRLFAVNGGSSGENKVLNCGDGDFFGIGAFLFGE